MKWKVVIRMIILAPISVVANSCGAKATKVTKNGNRGGYVHGSASVVSGAWLICQAYSLWKMRPNIESKTIRMKKPVNKNPGLLSFQTVDSEKREIFQN
jgi:hypothetical protein